VVAREALAVSQIRLGAPAELAAVVVASEQERIRYLPAEPAGDVHEANQPNDGRSWNGQPLRSHVMAAIRFDDFRLAIDYEAERPSNGDHGERFK
jgi:hypothetical protein